MWTTPNSKKNLIKTNMREILNQKRKHQKNKYAKILKRKKNIEKKKK